MKREILLDGQWKLYYYDTLDGTSYTEKELAEKQIPQVAATVPGNVEIDLSHAGILPEDLYKGMMTRENEKYETYDWWYQTEFETPEMNAGERLQLQFEGVDCIAEYFLNGSKIGESKNALMAHTFDITEFAVTGERNKLSVHISSVLPEVLNADHTALTLTSWMTQGGAFVRKPAHSFGWDISPRAVSAGIWKSVKLVVQDAYDLKEVFYTVEQSKENNKLPVLRFYYQIAAPYEKMVGSELSVHICGRCGEDSRFEQTIPVMPKNVFGKCIMPVNNPKLWWPYGYGEPNVYETVVELLDGDKVVAKRELTVGLRTAKLKMSESLLVENPCFQFVINGVDVVCRGSNWVPMDAYHSRDLGRYEKAFELVSDIGCNMLRVWGGGVYEQDCFYDYCDRHGIMIWQDFMMACQVYPFDEGMLGNMEQEFVYQVRRLRHHPSLVLWAGDNEIDLLFSGIHINPDGNIITRKLIPEVLCKHDPFRSYLPSSPYVSGKQFKDMEKGLKPVLEDHLWGARDYYKADFYKNSAALFVSEIGYHGCPSLESVKKIVDEEAVWPVYNEQWTLHSSDQKGNNSRVRLMAEQIRQLFGFDPETLEEFSLASQISQAEAKKYFIERIRVDKPNKSGILWWNLLDGWPQMSDAVVDYFYEKKLAYYYIKRAQAPFALMLGEMKDWHYTIYAVNDTLQTVEGTYRVTDIENGEAYAEGIFCVEPNRKGNLGRICMMYSDKKMLLIEWKINGRTYYNHYLCGMPGFSFPKYVEWLNKLKEICGDE